MNNEPVAWIANDADLPLKEDGSYWLYPENPSEDNLYIPLYTHPVKEEGEQQNHQEADGCPTELAVLQRFWRKSQEK